MRISDWSSDVCSSDLIDQPDQLDVPGGLVRRDRHRHVVGDHHDLGFQVDAVTLVDHLDAVARAVEAGAGGLVHQRIGVETLRHLRSEEHTSELQSLMRISYAVFCLKKKKNVYLKLKYKI